MALASLERQSAHRCFGGEQSFWRHASDAVGLPMRFGLYLPPQALAGERVPLVACLAGLTCTEETFAMKAGAQRAAARLGLALLTPDTSPRGAGIEGEDHHWEFGVGAGFYLDATQAPWSQRFRMESWITGELRELVLAQFPARADRVGLFGHSMGGHGALTLALRHPGLYQSVSALAPIAAPQHCAWGQKAFAGYLGEDRSLWAAHDACALIEAGHKAPPLLVDQGEADKFLAEQLLPRRFEAACLDAGQPLTMRRHAGYDHGYYFIASVVGEHLRHHAATLCA